MKETIALVDKSQCTGCGACAQACPFECISMESDKEGFLAPNINNSQCVECGLCAKVCHVLNEVPLSEPRRGFAFSSKDTHVYHGSASGGAFTLIAKQFICKTNGIVYGAAFDKSGHVVHLGVNNEGDLIKLQNSKYVQSDTTSAFREIKENLEKGIKVLFAGTGCQVAALQCYLKKQYENLYLIDIICHGVPSPGFFQRHVESLCDLAESTIIFRRKGGGEVSQYCLMIEQKGKKVYFADADADAYMSLFIHGQSFREACYSCHYSRKARSGDLTIGDISHKCILGEGLTPLTCFSGILINTEKATELVDYLTLEKAEIHEIDIDKYVESNRRLKEPAKRPTSRDDIYPIIMETPYSPEKLGRYLEKQSFSKRVKKAIKSMIPIEIQRVLKGI